MASKFETGDVSWHRSETNLGKNDPRRQRGDGRIWVDIGTVHKLDDVELNDAVKFWQAIRQHINNLEKN